MASVAEDLKRVPLFSGLSQRQLRRLAKDFRDRLVPAGSVLTKQGEMSGVDFFVIAEGEAAVTVDGKAGGHDGAWRPLGRARDDHPTRAHGHRGGSDADALPHDPVLALPGVANTNPDVTWKLLQHVAGILLTEQSRHAAQAESAPS